jgi:hypothetical protein
VTLVSTNPDLDPIEIQVPRNVVSELTLYRFRVGMILSTQVANVSPSTFIAYTPEIAIRIISCEYAKFFAPSVPLLTK